MWNRIVRWWTNTDERERQQRSHELTMAMIEAGRRAAAKPTPTKSAVMDLEAICPYCRATCGLSAPRVAEIGTLCEPHREHAERHRVMRPRSEATTQAASSYGWRKIGDPWTERGD